MAYHAQRVAHITNGNAVLYHDRRSISLHRRWTNYTPCEPHLCEVVLRTLFCSSQNARGAICTRSLASELADSLRLIITRNTLRISRTALPFYITFASANISRHRRWHILSSPTKNKQRSRSLSACLNFLVMNLAAPNVMRLLRNRYESALRSL